MLRVCIILGFLTLTVWGVDRNNFKTCEQSAFCRRNRRLQPGKSPFIASTATAVQVDDRHITVDLINTLNQQAFVLYLEAIEGPSVRMLIDEKNSAIKRYVALPALQPNIVNIPITLKSKGSDRLEATFGEGDSHRILVLADPFKVEVYSGDTLVITANGRGLMKFEHYRQREQKNIDESDTVTNVEQDANQENKPEEDTTKVSYNERGEKIVDGKPAPSGGFFSRLWDGEATKAEDANQPEGAPQEAAEEPVAEADGEDLDGAWEETFKGHTDSKERGPMSVGMDFTFEGFDFIYGLPEHADRFALSPTKNTEWWASKWLFSSRGLAVVNHTTNETEYTGKTDPYRMYNLDVFEYEIYNPMALYGAVPYIIAHNEKHTVAMLYLNPSETWIDVESPNGGMLSSMVGFVSNQKQGSKRETHWFSETGVLDVFFMVGPTPKQVAKQYAQITGVTALPPLFSLAYHQCRWNYNDQDDVRSVDATFDQRDIPYDVIWLDIEHTDGKRYFTWDAVKFSEPEQMIANLTAKGRRMVTIIDPHIKRDSNYFVHSEATAKGYYIKDKSGADYDGWCWPGSSSYLDFFNPEVRDYWADKFALDQYKGSTDQLFTWNDMNEPSVFNGPEVTMQKDCKHVGDLEHRDVHNLYGMMLHMSTYEGHIRRSQGKLRPFVLTRSFFAGTQRYGAVWTGDNMANWDHLRITIPMLLSLSVSGITFVGADVGGFFGNPDNEMVARWYQMAAYQPFFRGHAHHDSKRREPWLFDDVTNSIVREQLRMRYTMLPLWYTLFYENEQDAQPPMRPIWWDFPEDTEAFGLDDVHLLGNTLLVRPVLEQGATSVSIYFPGKDTVWYDIVTRQKFVGGKTLSQPVTIHSIPVFQRGGSILFTKERVRRSSALQGRDPYTLTVALDKAGTFANGTVYLDDEVSFDYRAGDLIYALAQYNKGVLSYQLIKGPGNFKTVAWVERVTIVGLAELPTKITNGEKMLEFSHSGHTVTIRKPAFHMDSQWSLKLHF